MTIRVTDKELLESVRASPAGREIIAQRDAALMDERKQQAIELVRVRKELADGLPRHDAAAEKARERFQKAHAARMAALQECAKAERERGTFAQHREQRIAELETALRRTAPPEIAAFVGGQILVDHAGPGTAGVVMTRAESTGLEGEIKRVQEAPLTERRHPKTGAWTNNQAQLSARIKAIREAQVKAALLMLEPLTSEEIADRLETIRAEIPAL